MTEQDFERKLQEEEVALHKQRFLIESYIENYKERKKINTSRAMQKLRQ